MSAFPPLAISAGRLGRGESYRPAAIGAIKRCLQMERASSMASRHGQFIGTAARTSIRRMV
jgi:hypothetical protein